MVFLDRVINLCCAHGKETISTLTNKANKDEVEEKPAAAPVKTQKLPVKKTSSSPFSDKDCKYDTVDYKDLSASLQKAVTALGFTPEAWDAGEWPAVEHKSFASMTSEERAAAEELGWTAPAWDHEYEECNWADLPDIVKKAATSSGFTEEMWDGDEWPESLDKHWSELTADQKRAMNVLGYTYWDWD